MIELRVVEDAELGLWADLKTRVVPNEPVTEEQLRAADEPDRLLLLAELDGALAGCGIADRSNFGGRAFIAARVLPELRRRGVGSALVGALARHARTLGLSGVNAFVYANEPHSIAFAESYRLAEADYQLGQVRVIGAEARPEPPGGIELVALAGRREELLRAAWPVALEGYDDLPLPGEVTYRLETWLRDEATRPEGSFVALDGSDVVGFAGLSEHAGGPGDRRARLDGGSPRPAPPRDRPRVEGGAARLGCAGRRHTPRHVDSEGQRGDAGVEPQPRVRRRVEGDHLPGAAAGVIRLGPLSFSPREELAEWQ